jgi:hypothetical protein
MWRTPPASEMTPGFSRTAEDVATYFSGLLEELKYGVLRSEAVGATSGHACACKGLPHHLDISFCVTMCRSDLGVSEPRLNRDQVHTGLQELHRQGVSEEMGRNMRVRECRSLDRGMCDGAANEMRRTEPSKAVAVYPDEDGTSLVAPQPARSTKRPQHSSEVGGKGHDALLATLAVKEHLVGGSRRRSAASMPMVSDTRAPVRTRKSKKA